MFPYPASKAEQFLCSILYIEGKHYVMYGKSEYSIRVFLEILYAGGNPTEWQTAFNAKISKVKITTKWFLADIKKCGTFVDCKRRICILHVPVGSLFLAAVLFINFRIVTRSIKRPNTLTARNQL